MSAAADAASSVDAEVQEVDALVDALRGLACDDDASDGTDSPRFADASNGALDDSADSFRSAEDETTATTPTRRRHRRVLTVRPR